MRGKEKHVFAPQGRAADGVRYDICKRCDAPDAGGSGEHKGKSLAAVAVIEGPHGVASFLIEGIVV